MTRPARQWISVAALVLLTTGTSAAQQPAPDDATRYMAMGDSIAAGYKAQPATQGYAFVLYQSGAFDHVSRTVFNNVAAVGASSQDVLDYQVPLALIPAARGGFVPGHVTLTAGGNDIADVLRFAATGPAPAVLQAYATAALVTYQNNLAAILQALTLNAPGRRIYVGNQYSVPEIEALLPQGAQLLAAFNATTAAVVSAFPGRAYLVDVHAAFDGRRGLLLIDRQSASLFEVHLTNAGHRAMAQAFADVIAAVN
jgi:lysophospholipase L1-like esterase